MRDIAMSFVGLTIAVVALPYVFKQLELAEESKEDIMNG